MEMLKIDPLPFISASLCGKENPIKDNFDEYLGSIKKADAKDGIKVAIVGGGVTGMAAAYFLAKEGVDTTIYEQSSSLGGAVNMVVPEFKIAYEDIEKDAMLLQSLGVTIKLNEIAPDLKELIGEEFGYTHVLYAIGAWKRGLLYMDGNEVNVLDFLKDIKDGVKFDGVKNIAVIGGGNKAVIAARAAKRLEGIEDVTVVYWGSKEKMSAAKEEIALALEEGVDIIENCEAIKQADGKLVCKNNADEEISIAADMAVTAVGDGVGLGIFDANGIDVWGKRVAEFKTNIDNVYTAGACHLGKANITECIADAEAFAKAVLK